MLRVLSMCNNNSISRLLLVIILFVFVALVATNNAKSAEALDFDAAFAAEELGHSLQYERGSCNSNTTSISGATKQACIADATIAEEGEEKWHTTRATTQILSRHKRFLAFPLGSSFSCAVCLTTGVVGNPNYQYLSMGLNWGFAYDLPNATWVLDHAHALGRRKNDEDIQKVEEPTIKRRHRRELYQKVETIMNK
ncbi:PREDICTED: uncharacterized protein LOC108379260 [Rhagoletis zephyria]|uniref:uncharacterized protein LOC108379260 n=1 Tax=Rhagoletis zephyria TaxID=28612 RepID=UPI0008112418|nr:PREDICTED: uncharacterized protein LOC108379260 [Rhagoletis zephyria]